MRTDTDETNVYRIRVRGQLSRRWADWFDGFQMTSQGDETVLTGPVIDQAALHGALAKIRDLGLPILLVENLEGQAGEADERS